MKQNFSTLDGMRGIAAIFVLISHTGLYWNGLIFKHTHLAVDMFFVLSGFVIGYAYEHKLTSGALTYKEFIVIRLIRLYPMYFISVFFATTVAVLGYVSSEHQNAGYLKDLIISTSLTFLFLPSFIANSINLFPLNGAYWSIFYELVVNFSYAILKPILNKKVLITILLIFAGLLCLIVYLNGTLGAGFTWRYTSIATAITRSGFGIFLGVHLNRIGKNYWPNFVPSAWLILSLMSLVLMLPNLGALDGVVDLFAVFIIFPFCVVFGARCKPSQVTNSIFKVLGQSSYPLYLLHVPISVLLYSLLGQTINQHAPLSGIFLVLGLILFTILLERLYDLPVRKYLGNRYLKRINKSY